MATNDSKAVAIHPALLQPKTVLQHIRLDSGGKRIADGTSSGNIIPFAINDGASHPISTFVGAGKAWADLAAVQTDYPHVTSTAQELAYAAIQSALNTGLTIEIPDGHYMLSTGLVMDATQAIAGKSRANCILEFSGTTTAISIVPELGSFAYDIDSSLRIADLTIIARNGILIGRPDAIGAEWQTQGVVKGAILEHLCLIGKYGPVSSLPDTGALPDSNDAGSVVVAADPLYETAVAVSDGELEPLGVGISLGKAYNWHIRNCDIRAFGIGVKSSGSAEGNLSVSRIWQCGRWVSGIHISNDGEWGDDNTLGPSLDLLDNKRVGGIYLNGTWRWRILSNFFETYTAAATYFKCVNDIGTQVSHNDITNTQQSTTPIFDLDSRYSCRMENNSFGTSSPIPPVLFGHTYWTYQQPTLWTFINNSPEFYQLNLTYPHVEVEEHDQYLFQANNARDLGGIVAGSWMWAVSPSTGRYALNTVAASLIWKPALKNRQYRNFGLFVTGRYMGINGPPQPLNGTGYVVAKYVEGATTTTLFQNYVGIRNTTEAQSKEVRFELPPFALGSGRFEIEVYNTEIELERMELIPYKGYDPYVLDFEHDPSNLIGNGAVNYPWWITSPVTGRQVLQTTTSDIQWEPYIQDRSQRSFIITTTARKIGSGGSGYTVVNYIEGATTTNLFTGYAGFTKTTEVEAKSIHVTIPASANASGYFNVLLVNTEMEVERVVLAPAALPRDTRRGIASVVGSEADGNLFALEQVSSAQTGDAAAIRMVFATDGYAYAAIGRYTDAAAFVETLRVSQNDNVVVTRKNNTTAIDQVALVLKNAYVLGNLNNPAISFWNGVTGSSAYGWICEADVAGTTGFYLKNQSGATQKVVLVVSDAGQVSLTGSFGSAYLHLPASDGAYGHAPLKIAAGTLVTVPENGAIEFDGADIYITAAGVRNKLSGQVPSVSGHTDQFLHVNGSTNVVEWSKIYLNNSSQVSIPGTAGDFAVREGGGALTNRAFNDVGADMVTYLLGSAAFKASLAADSGFRSTLEGYLDARYEKQSALGYDVSALGFWLQSAGEAYVASYVAAHPGPQGPTGPRGPTGPASTAIGPTGPTGPRGPTGP